MRGISRRSRSGTLLAGSRADSWKPWYSPFRERRRPQASPWGGRGSAGAQEVRRGGNTSGGEGAGSASGSRGRVRRSPNMDLRSRLSWEEQENLPAYVENMVESGRVETFSDNGQQ